MQPRHLDSVEGHLRWRTVMVVVMVFNIDVSEDEECRLEEMEMNEIKEY